MAEIDLPDIDSGSWAKYQADQLGAYAQQKLTAQPAVETPAVETPAVETPIAEAPPEPGPAPAKLPDWVPDYAKNTLATGTIQPGPAVTARPLQRNGVYYSDPDFEQNISRYGAEIAKYLGPATGQFAIAQARLETGNGANLSTPYNYGNVGNTDSNPKGGGRYSGPEEAAQAWVRFITNNGNDQPGANRYNAFTTAAKGGADMGTLAQLIKNAGYATDPNYVSKLMATATKHPAPDLSGVAADLPSVDQQSYADQQQQVLQDYAQQKVAPPAAPAKSPIPFVDFAKDKIGGFIQKLQQATNDQADASQALMAPIGQAKDAITGADVPGTAPTLGPGLAPGGDPNFYETPVLGGIRRVGQPAMDAVDAFDQAIRDRVPGYARLEDSPDTLTAERLFNPLAGQTPGQNINVGQALNVAAMAAPAIKPLEAIKGALGIGRTAAEAGTAAPAVADAAATVLRPGLDAETTQAFTKALGDQAEAVQAAQASGDTAALQAAQRSQKNLQGVLGDMTPEAVAAVKSQGIDLTDPQILQHLGNWRGAAERFGQSALNAGRDALGAGDEAVSNAVDYAKSFLRSEAPAGGPGAMTSALPRLADIAMGTERAPLATASAVNSTIQKLFDATNYSAVPGIKGAIFVNENARRSWDAAAGMLQDSINRILPDAAERSRVVTEYNDPAAVATWTAPMRAAASVWDTAQEAAFNLAKKAGVLDNYLEEYMARISKSGQGGGPGMANFSDYTPAAIQRKAPTYADFEAALAKMGKTAVTDLGDVINAHVDSLGRATENSRFVTFAKTQLQADGRPTLWSPTGIKAAAGNVAATAKVNRPPSDYITVPVKGLTRFVYRQLPDDTGMLRQTPLFIHPDAAKAFQDLLPQAHGALDPIANFISKFNRLAAWGIMYNPLIHGANVAGPGMAGSTWANALTGGAQSWRVGMAALRGNQEDVLKLIRAGLDTTANQRARETMLNATIDQHPELFDSIKNMPVVGGIKEANDKVLWDGIVQPYQVGSALLLSRALQRGGALQSALPGGIAKFLENVPMAGAAFRGPLAEDAANQVAARAANTMFGQIPAETMSSAARKWAGLALFARNWTTSLYRTYAGSLGLYKDAQLAPEAAARYRQVLGDYVARSVLMGGGIHEALNYHLSGHSSLDNAPGHKLDIAVTNPNGGESYYAFPLFKQIQDGLGVLGLIPGIGAATGKNPMAEGYAKLSPFIHAGVDLVGGDLNVAPGTSVALGKSVPLYSTKKDGPLVQALKVAAETAGDTTPLGFRTTSQNGPEQVQAPFGVTVTPALGREGIGGPSENPAQWSTVANVLGAHERGNPSTIASDEAQRRTDESMQQLPNSPRWQELTPDEQTKVQSEVHAVHERIVNQETFGRDKTPQTQLAAISRELDKLPLTDAQRAEVQLYAAKRLKEK